MAQQIIQLKAAERLKAGSLKRFAVYVNNGFRFDLETVIESESLSKARKEWLRINQGTLAGDPKNIKMKDVTGLSAWNNVPVFKTRRNENASLRLHAGRETSKGAGALYYSEATGKFLILLRSDDGDDGNVWCCLGGGVDPDDKDDEFTVRREAFEEAGLDMDTPTQFYHLGDKHYDDGFTFRNFLGIIEDEFLPIINHEHKSFQWCDWHEFPENMHEGMMSVLNTPEAQRVLHKYTNAFDNRSL